MLTICFSAKQQKLVDGNAKEILKEICAFAHKLEGVHEHAENPLPFVYKTMVSFVVYIYIVLSALAEQDIGKTHVDLYFPIFGFLKVFIFATWLKVALAMQNPIKDDLPLNKSFEEFREGYEMLLKDDLDLDKLNESS